MNIVIILGVTAFLASIWGVWQAFKMTSLYRFLFQFNPAQDIEWEGRTFHEDQENFINSLDDNLSDDEDWDKDFK